jgi:hypothetical protein
MNTPILPVILHSWRMARLIVVLKIFTVVIGRFSLRFGRAGSAPDEKNDRASAPAAQSARPLREWSIFMRYPENYGR